AIKQALRRRLLVLLVREQIDVEKKRRTNFEPELATQYVRLQDEMRVLAREILLTSGTTINDADADAYIAQVRQRIARKLAAIKGGPLEDKIEAAERFWDETGAKFLLSTSAGGEGINLQCARVLFNYDLPWNPMAVEQRIGRIHRFGQKDVAQVYNLVAKDTVEERVYGLLTEKLQAVARAIGKVDRETGEPLEDFRLDI